MAIRQRIQPAPSNEVVRKVSEYKPVADKKQKPAEIAADALWELRKVIGEHVDLADFPIICNDQLKGTRVAMQVSPDIFRLIKAKRAQQG